MKRFEFENVLLDNVVIKMEFSRIVTRRQSELESLLWGNRVSSHVGRYLKRNIGWTHWIKPRYLFSMLDSCVWTINEQHVIDVIKGWHFIAPSKFHPLSRDELLQLSKQKQTVEIPLCHIISLRHIKTSRKDLKHTFTITLRDPSTCIVSHDGEMPLVREITVTMDVRNIV